MNNNLTNREIACLVWNTMYGGERRPFKDIPESAKQEWEKWAATAKDILDIRNDKTIYLIKEKLKDQL